ncbi:MAG: hypothetical protein QOH86_2153, partial [Sphingomonadales bacterium]|nr:hypothetical protein [Sphingomonadales bacterium]
EDIEALKEGATVTPLVRRRAVAAP